MWIEVTTLATEMMFKFCDLSLKTIYITHQYEKKKKNIEMQVLFLLLSQGSKNTQQSPKIAHILYNIIRNVVAISTPNRNLILHLNYIYIYLHHLLGLPMFRATLCK